MSINEKAAYLKGLFDGSDLQPTKENKIINEMLQLLGDMATKISELEAENAELREYIEEIDEDLGAVEEEFYFTDSDDEDEGDYDDLNDEDEDYDFDEDSEYYELECPNCGETVCFDDSLEPDDLVCPACGQKVGDIEFCDGECESCEKACDEE